MGTLVIGLHWETPLARVGVDGVDAATLALLLLVLVLSCLSGNSSENFSALRLTILERNLMKSLKTSENLSENPLTTFRAVAPLSVTPLPLSDLFSDHDPVRNFLIVLLSKILVPRVFSVANPCRSPR